MPSTKNMWEHRAKPHLMYSWHLNFDACISLNSAFSSKEVSCQPKSSAAHKISAYIREPVGFIKHTKRVQDESRTTECWLCAWEGQLTESRTLLTQTTRHKFLFSSKSSVNSTKCDLEKSLNIHLTTWTFSCIERKPARQGKPFGLYGKRKLGPERWESFSNLSCTAI